VPVKCRLCVDKAAVVTPTREHFESAVLVLPLLPLDQASLSVDRVVQVEGDLRAEESLHLIHCVWLC
jgi:hypothetical protein